MGQISGLGPDPLLSAIKLTSDDKIISIKEVGLADSNFIITYLMKKIFQCNDKLIFVNFHNSIDHYQHVGKKLGYDLLNKVNIGDAVIVDMLKEIEEEISDEDTILFGNKQEFVEKFFSDIEQRINEIRKINEDHIFVIIDDLTHLLDIGVDVEIIQRFITWCCNIKTNSVSVIINNHVSRFEINNDLRPDDNIVANSLSYTTDLEIEVALMKNSGLCNDVTGVINVARPGEATIKLHYKAFDRGIKTFKPGDAV